MKFRAACTISLGGFPVPPGVPFEPSDEQRYHLESQGVLLELVEEAPAVPPEPPADPPPPPSSLEERVAALTAKDDALALATELGFVLSETKLSKMKAEILALASKPTET